MPFRQGLTSGQNLQQTLSELLFVTVGKTENVLGSPKDGQNYLTYGQCGKDRILMPENPTDGDSRQAESTRRVTTNSTRTKSKGSLGAGGQKRLDRDQDQWVTGSRRNGSTRTKTKGSRGDNAGRTRPGPKPEDHGETGGKCKLNQD